MSLFLLSLILLSFHLRVNCNFNLFRNYGQLREHWNISTGLENQDIYRKSTLFDMFGVKVSYLGH